LSCITAPVISACSYLGFPWAATWSGRPSPSPVCTVNCVPTQRWCPNILSVISKCTPCYHYYRKSISWPAMHMQLISLHPTLCWLFACLLVSHMACVFPPFAFLPSQQILITWTQTRYLLLAFL
jgi:hypothetical protein